MTLTLEFIERSLQNGSNNKKCIAVLKSSLKRCKKLICAKTCLLLPNQAVEKIELKAIML